MSFEYLIVGIARGEQNDFREFYDKTKVEAYMFALSIVKDRVLARDIAVEAYKRVQRFAYKFDTELNAEYWLLDIVKNLSVNALRHDDIGRMSAAKRVDNLTGLLAELILDASEERAQFVVLRTVSGLNKAEISRLLWYKSGSASAEYGRAIKALVATAPEYRTKSSVKQDLFEDMNSCTPDMWGLVIQDDDTKVSFVSHEELDIDDNEVGFSEDSEEIKKIKRAADKKNRKIKIITVVVAIIAVCALVAGVVAAVVAYNKEQARKKNEEENTNKLEVTLPQSGTSIAMAELDGILYFANYTDGGKLYKADFSSGSATVTKISDDRPRDIVVCSTGGKYVVYRNQADGHAYRYSPADGTTELLYKTVGAMCVSGDTLYFNVSSVGICSVKIAEGESSFKEVLLKDNNFPAVVDIEIDDNGKIYFSGGANSGIYYIKDEYGENSEENSTFKEEFYVGSVYDMHLYGSEIFFDISENYSASFCKIDTQNNNKVTQVKDVYLSSAAIFVDNGYIYYAGYDADPEENDDAKRGLFRVSVAGGTPEMIVMQNDETLHISDLYVTSERIYCYSCTADGKSKQSLVAYSIDGTGADNLAEKSVTVF